MNDQQFQKVKSGSGFIAALDQSGGSTPRALQLYGIEEDAYTGDDEMFALMHAFRSRMIMSPSFNGDRILGAILFENTMDRTIADRESAEYLWDVKGVVLIRALPRAALPRTSLGLNTSNREADDGERRATAPLASHREAGQWTGSLRLPLCRRRSGRSTGSPSLR